MSWITYILLGLGIFILLFCIFYLAIPKKLEKEGLLDYFNVESYLQTLQTTQGRYVRITPSTTSGDGFMTFSQIQVLDMNGNNIAKGRPVTASPTAAGSAQVSSTVDGTESARKGTSYVWTSASTNGSWEVDLGKTYQLNQITCIGVLDATLAIANRNNGLNVSILNENKVSVLSRTFPSNELNQTITLPNAINLTPYISSSEQTLVPSVIPINSPKPEVFFLDTPTSSQLEADVMCNTLGTNLATMGQLSEAQKNGAEWCNYGWVKDSANQAYPMQRRDVPGCSGSPGVQQANRGNTAAGVNCIGIKPAKGIHTKIKDFNSYGVWSQYVGNASPSYFGTTQIELPNVESIYNEVRRRWGTGSRFNSPPKTWVDPRPDLSGSALYSTLIGTSPLNFLYDEGSTAVSTITSLKTSIQIFGSVSTAAINEMNASLDLCKRIFLGSPGDVDKYINIKYDSLKPFIRPQNGFTNFCRSELVMQMNTRTGNFDTVLSTSNQTFNVTNSACSQELTPVQLGLLPYAARNFIITWVYQRTKRIITTKFASNATDLSTQLNNVKYMIPAVEGSSSIPFDISQPYNLDLIAQSFYEGMGGNYTMTNIYDVSTIGASILDVRFDMTKHADISSIQTKIAELKNKYISLRNSNVSEDILDTAKSNYTDLLSTYQSDQMSNIYPAILGVVARFFYTYNVNTGIFNITGFTLDARAVTSFIPELNGGIQVATGSNTGMLNYAPNIKYTLNISENLQCSNPTTLRRIMDDYLDASLTDLKGTLKDASPSVDTNKGRIIVNEILGSVQISKGQCGVTWKETLWNDTANAPVAANTTNITRNGLFTYVVNQEDWYSSDIIMDVSGFILYPSSSIPACRFDTAAHQELYKIRLANASSTLVRSDFLNNTFNNGKGNPCPHILPLYSFNPKDYLAANTDLNITETGAASHYKTSGFDNNRPVKTQQTITPLSPTIVITKPLPPNSFLDTADDACPRTTCEDLNVLYTLADGYNNDPTVPGSILRITRAYTPNLNQCDIEVDINYDTMVEDTVGATVKKGSFTFNESGAQIPSKNLPPSGLKKAVTLGITVEMDLATCKITYSGSDVPGSGTSIQSNTPALYKPMEYATELQKVTTSSLNSSFDSVAKVVSDVANTASSILTTYRTETVAAVGNVAFLGTCPSAKCSDTVNMNAMLSYHRSINRGQKQINNVLRVGTLDDKTCDLTFQEDTFSPGTLRVVSSQTAAARFTMTPAATPCNFTATAMTLLLPAPPPDLVATPTQKPNSAICNEVYAIGGYNYTPTTAAAKCATYGGVLATYKQLQAAQEAGADWCSTGWLADMSGTAYYPITTSIQAGCGGGSPGIKIFTPGTAGANCFGVKPRQGQHTDVLPFAGATWNQPNTCGRFVNYVNPFKEAFADYKKPIRVTESTFPLNTQGFGLIRRNDDSEIDSLFKEPLRQTLSDETLPSTKSRSYKYIRFRPIKTRNPSNPEVSVGKFRFFLGENEIDIQNAKVTNPMGSWVGDVEQLSGEGYVSGWSDLHKKAIIFAFPYAVLMDGFSWTTANPDKGFGGDPVQWKLEASQNGVYWTLIRDQTKHDYPVPKDRYQELPIFRF